MRRSAGAVAAAHPPQVLLFKTRWISVDALEVRVVVAYPAQTRQITADHLIQVMIILFCFPPALAAGFWERRMVRQPSRRDCLRAGCRAAADTAELVSAAMVAQALYVQAARAAAQQKTATSPGTAQRVVRGSSLLWKRSDA